MRIELLRSMGDDLVIVNSARCSYAKESGWGTCTDGPEGDGEKVLKPADAGLVNYLMRERHGTPFEMVVFTFRVAVPIAVAREWQRHRIGSYNEVSSRYTEMPAEFYVPAPSAVRAQTGKPGHYEMAEVPDALARWAVEKMAQSYRDAYEAYQLLLQRGVAKELARNVLPLGLMTAFIWTVNARSLFNFLQLRTSPTALLEIREAASEVERLARPVCPVAFAAFDQHGRVAP